MLEKHSVCNFRKAQNSLRVNLELSGSGVSTFSVSRATTFMAELARSSEIGISLGCDNHNNLDAKTLKSLSLPSVFLTPGTVLQRVQMSVCILIISACLASI